VRIGTCAVTGGFMHLYAALENRLFDKHGLDAEDVVVRGGSVALAADEINFLFCNTDANIGRNFFWGTIGEAAIEPLTVWC